MAAANGTSELTWPNCLATSNGTSTASSSAWARNTGTRRERPEGLEYQGCLARPCLAFDPHDAATARGRLLAQAAISASSCARPTKTPPALWLMATCRPFLRP